MWSASAWGDEPTSSPSAAEPASPATAGAGFYTTPGYVGDPELRPRPADAGLEHDCDRDDTLALDGDPRCRDVEIDADGAAPVRSPAMIVVGSALTVIGGLGMAGGVALLNHDAETPTGGSTGLRCTAGTQTGIDCNPSVDTSGTEEALFTVAGVGSLVLGGAVAVGGVALVVVGALPGSDDPTPRVRVGLAPTRATVDVTF